MCNTQLHHHAYNNAMEPLSFSTFHLLRNCNRLVPPTDAGSLHDLDTKANMNCISAAEKSSPLSYSTLPCASVPQKSPIDDSISLSMTDSVDIDVSVSRSDDFETSENVLRLPAGEEKGFPTLNCSTLFRKSDSLPINLHNLSVLPLAGSSLMSNKSALPAFEYIAPANHPDFSLMDLNRVGLFPAFLHRRPRGEKRPIPDEQKDEKYYERRKRNNEAAKKSRDARKVREDRIAFKAAMLEQENSILRAQVMALRDELQTIRQIMSATSVTIAGPGGSRAALL